MLKEPSALPMAPISLEGSCPARPSSRLTMPPKQLRTLRMLLLWLCQRCSGEVPLHSVHMASCSDRCAERARAPFPVSFEPNEKGSGKTLVILVVFSPSTIMKTETHAILQPNWPCIGVPMLATCKQDSEPKSGTRLASAWSVMDKLTSKASVHASDNDKLYELKSLHRIILKRLSHKESLQPLDCTGATGFSLLPTLPVRADFCLKFKNCFISVLLTLNWQKGQPTYP